MKERKIVVIGAGMGGLAAALALAARGLDVTVCDRAARPGGKMREIVIDGRGIDSGPTVFTMRWVFEELFAEAGLDFADAVVLTPLAILARHAWSESERFDLFADIRAAADSVGRFAGAGEAQRFRRFCDEARSIYTTLKETYLAADKPSMTELTRRIGFTRIGALTGMRPFETMWRALGAHFTDGRLRQLFGRYATYVGSSPFAAPATLMLIAHVEQEGVWSVEGGMARLAEALQLAAEKHGARFRFSSAVARIETEKGRASGVVLETGERLAADAVVLNADAAALSGRLFGEAAAYALDPWPRAERSLSAVTWSLIAPTRGFPLLRHNVFFSNDYPAEFTQLFTGRRVPAEPTVYVCAQDRGDSDDVTSLPAAERLLVLINAPAFGDTEDPDEREKARWETAAFGLLERSGLTITRTPMRTVMTDPNEFNRLFPMTGGALYGRATHGFQAPFKRPGSHTRLPGLYLAGGSAHPGAGVPMATLSGRLAAARILADLGSMPRFRPAGISGGTRTR
jgi:1-hydroxycarotenoid 3,4-desaturase